MKAQSSRKILYIKDIMKLTNRKYGAARRLAQIIKEHYGVALISTDAFCEFASIREDTMREYLNENE